eukprot:CAMPEP_0194184196 /NCGR_PEP_ID=MMETSP0154-20130528/36354_1 /TAXON_ID=1049557 /ORGANISM="Thalassiothrix antarctica, Strain L6-D1" /LENGTH=178 /DNA_ID=CAMNT_0038901675 /DNA_START=64 /DNA_END=600 /DNA_ORIENTATION=-
MSAISIDQLGEVQSWWEACSGKDGDGTRPTLAGFVNGNRSSSLKKIVESNPDDIFEHILNTITKVYGVDVETLGYDKKKCSDAKTSGSPGEDGLIVSKGGITVTYKSWKEDPCTNRQNKGGTTSYSTTEYGDPWLQHSVGPLFFAGCEAAYGSGHMDSAVVAGQRVSEEVEAHLSRGI